MEFECSLILQTLEEVGWVIGGPKGAAAKLGLKRTTLIHRMQKLGIYRHSLPPTPTVSSLMFAVLRNGK
jgi:formate hydrogenlyase transcriptional activator